MPGAAGLVPALRVGKADAWSFYIFRSGIIIIVDIPTLMGLFSS
jgi:hypothetical protein